MRIRVSPRRFQAWVTVQGITATGNAAIDELNKIERRSSTRKKIFNWACGIAIIGIFFFHGLPLLTLPLFVIARFMPARRVVIMYEIDESFSEWYGYLLEIWQQLAASGGRWLLLDSTPTYSTYEWKVNAGADAILARLPAAFQFRTSSPLKTNLPAPTVAAGPHRLVFLPDQILVRAGKYWSGTQYNDLTISHSQSRFIEDSPPHDGIVVGETWRYKNVNGSPDRRFNNNFLLPIMLYSEIRLSAPTGFNCAMHISRQDPVEQWFAVLVNHPYFDPAT